MLILSRKRGQTIVLEFRPTETAEPITATIRVVKMKHMICDIGIDADPQVHVRRGELSGFPKKEKGS